MEKRAFTPYVPEKTDLREFTLRALLLGLTLTVVLGAANAYLGLKAGMTIAATYPAAVLGMAVLRIFKGSILEENITRSSGSVGEALAAGAIFTLPAFFMTGVWKEMTSAAHYVEATLIMAGGGLLGILFVTMLRRVLVNDAELPYPESVAASEIHKAGRRGGSGAVYLLWAMAVGAAVKLAASMSLFATRWERFVHFARSGISLFGSRGELLTKVSAGGGTLLTTPQVSPAYVGVGYIIGLRLAALSFAGGLLAWGLFVPLLLYVVGPSLEPAMLERGMGTDWISMSYAVWMYLVRPIAIGGMLVSAGYTLYRMRKSLFTGLSRSVGDLVKAASAEEETSRLDRDISFRAAAPLIALLSVGAGFLFYYFCGNVAGAVAAALVTLVTGFFFAAVSGYLVGMIGSSSNPVSGLTISALIIAALLMVLLGVTGAAGVAAVLGVAAFVCVSSAVAGGMLQDLKAGQFLGGTPWKMQVGNIVSVLVAACVMFVPIVFLHQADINLGGTGLGGRELPAPQAGLMAMLTQGIVAGEMAWPLVIVGMIMAVAMICIQVRSPMLVSVGMYLPFGTVAAIFVGGLIRGIADKVAERRRLNDAQKIRVENGGVLLASGLIAGEALMGLVIAGFAVFSVFLPKLIPSPSFLWGVVIFALLGLILVRYPLKCAGSPDEPAPPSAMA